MLSLLLREKVFVPQFSPLDLNAYQRLFHQLVGEACWAFLFGIIIGPYGANIFLIPNLNFLSSLAVAAFSRQQLSARQTNISIFPPLSLLAAASLDPGVQGIGENLAPKYCFPERSQRHAHSSLFQGERAEAQRHFKEDLGRLLKAVDDNPAETRRRQKKIANTDFAFSEVKGTVASSSIPFFDETPSSRPGSDTATPRHEYFNLRSNKKVTQQDVFCFLTTLVSNVFFLISLAVLCWTHWLPGAVTSGMIRKVDCETRVQSHLPSASL
ncbi:hypothetical protein F5879DRAFT_993674 [Lentinula edodes]|nr:hypothetical protein F5879DRAFT_993674 [Lentinula edodes]